MPWGSVLNTSMRRDGDPIGDFGWSARWSFGGRCGAGAAIGATESDRPVSSLRLTVRESHFTVIQITASQAEVMYPTGSSAQTKQS